MKSKILALALVSCLSLAACAQNGDPNAWGMGNKQTIGTLGGAAAGGLAGSAIGKGSGQLWATGAGALLGAFVGSSIGKSLDQSDMMYHNNAVNQAYNAQLGQQINWSNPGNNHSGSITPVREGRDSSTGALCRQFKQTIVVDGQAQTANGTACQNANGGWDITN